MLNFLLESGIQQSTIDELKDKCPESIQYSLNCKEYEIKKIITFLKVNGVNCCDDIIGDFPEFFLLSYHEFLKKIKKYDIKKLVELINANYYNVFLQLEEV